MGKIRLYDWEAIAVVAVAVVAVGLHLLGIANEEAVLTVAMVALAVLLIRDLVREERDKETNGRVEQLQLAIEDVRRAHAQPEAVLVGPHRLATQSQAFARTARGDMTWFNVCLQMFVRQAVCDVMLKPAIESENVRSIQFVLDESERGRWQNDVLPKVAACRHAAKVVEPAWCTLKEPVSFILSGDGEAGTDGQLSFWGEPFMASFPGRDVPRFIFELPAGSSLMPHLQEMARRYRMSSGSGTAGALDSGR
jgi:hypothetical protein